MIQIPVYQLSQVSQLLAKAHGRCAMARTRSTSAVNNVCFLIIHRIYLFVLIYFGIIVEKSYSGRLTNLIGIIEASLAAHFYFFY